MIPASYENISSALTFISPSTDREEWATVGMALKAGLNGEGFELFNDWSAKGDSYNATDTRDTWRSFNTGGGITLGTLFYLAKQNGWQPSATAKTETTAERMDREQQRKATAEKEAKTRADKAKAATAKVKALSTAATPAQADHPYLLRKAINPSGLLEIPAAQAVKILGYTPKADGNPLAGRLLLVSVEIDGALSTAELIDETGKKSAVAGGVKSGGYWTAKPLPANDSKAITFFIAEGVATVKSAVENTNYYGIAALSAGNMPKVAKSIRAKYPIAHLVMLADIGNGQKYAEQAAQETNAHLAIPFFTPEQVQSFQTATGTPPPILTT